MPTIKLVIEYEGSAYAGWQRQPDQPTIQGAIETAIQQVSQATIAVIGAGRTDSGVHARGQVASFLTDRDWGPMNWMGALNAVLPKDIAIRSTAIMKNHFHAQHDARGKLYTYRILQRQTRPTIDRAFVWHISRFLNPTAMHQATTALIGAHDFSSFEGSHTDNTNPICYLQRLTILQQGEEIVIEAYADRFLKHMVRAIVGTIIEVGLGQRAPESLREVLRARDRCTAGTTAPPQGLCLMHVDYD